MPAEFSEEYGARSDREPSPHFDHRVHKGVDEQLCESAHLSGYDKCD